MTSTTSTTYASRSAPVAGGGPRSALSGVAARLRSHIPVLDGLRGLAIALVVVHNVGIEQHRSSSALLKAIYFIHAPGWVGVQLFFALSGFLITGILVDARGPQSPSPSTGQALRTFWVRRALRIFPLYYAVLALATVVVPAVFTSPAVAELGHHRVWYWTYLANWSSPGGGEIPMLAHFWSLAVEEQFYLVWPLVVLALGGVQKNGRSWLLRVCLGMAAVSFVARVGMRLAGASPLAVYEYTVTRIDALTLGAAAALVARNGAWLAAVAPYLRRTVIGGLAVVLAMWPLTRGFNRDDVWVQTIGYGVLSVTFAALVLYVVVGSVAPDVPNATDGTTAGASRLARALSAPWLRWLGKYSYAIYIVHHPISKVLAMRLGPVINGDSPRAALAALAALQVAVAVLSVAVALLSWNLLEKWMLLLKDRLAPSAPAPGPTPGAPSSPRSTRPVPPSPDSRPTLSAS